MRMRFKSIILGVFLILGTTAIEAQRVYYPSGSLGDYLSFKNAVVGWGGGLVGAMQNQEYHRGLRFRYDDTGRKTIMEVISASDNASNNYFYDENLNTKSKKPLYAFYEYPSAFLAKKESDYVLVVNPVLNVWGGKESASSRTLYQNSRGAEVWGNIGGKQRGVGFYTYFTDNQMAMPTQYNQLPDSLNYVPSELFYKKFKTGSAVDFFQARGYVTWNAANQHINFKFGHDRNKIGQGYRSLILSDFAPQYLFLKINTNVGKVHYQNLFTQLTDNGQILGNTLFGKKYAAFHRLSFDITHNLNIGVNEMVVFDRHDSTQANQFDFNYLNPVIFYRAVESSLGSRDNSLLALDFNWTLRNRYLFYGQFLLDEFKLSELKNNKYWWGNKYGYQIGARAFDFLRIKGLDVLLEYNRIRPYTYSHYRTTQSYSHFNQPLAHPLGANFGESVLEVKYNLKKWFITITGIYAKRGMDSSLLGRNYGGNILRSYETRVTSNNSKMFMGNTQNLIIGEVLISYMLKHNLFIDLRYNYRSAGTQNNSFYGFGMRLNCNVRQANF